MQEAWRKTAKVAVPVVLSVGALYLAKYGFDHQILQHIPLGQLGGHTIDSATGQVNCTPQPYTNPGGQPLTPNLSCHVVDTNEYTNAIGKGIFGTIGALGFGGIATTAIYSIVKVVEKVRFNAAVKRNRRYSLGYAV